MNQNLDYDEETSRQLEAMYVTADVVAQRMSGIYMLLFRQLVPESL